jgi:hypothetical protein
MSECVMLLIIWSADHFVTPYIPNNWEWATQENQLHNRIVQGYEACKHIQVASSENKSIQLLCLQGNTWKEQKKGRNWILANSSCINSICLLQTVIVQHNHHRVRRRNHICHEDFIMRHRQTWNITFPTRF